jgi:hypothetical protein
MRRFVIFAVLCALSFPIGIAVTGCAKNNGQNYCTGFQSGLKVTATATIDLEPATYGVSLSYGQIAQSGTPRALTCKGQPSGLTTFTYGVTKPFPGNLYLADVSPSGKICGGTWNRNSGNGVPDFTTCIPPQPGSAIYQAGGGVAFLTASGGGATSNSVPIFVHPPITSIVLGGTPHNCPNLPLTSSPTNVGIYQPNTCVSQNQTAQLSATVYSGTEDITCSAGHLNYASSNNTIVSIDQNGVATAHQPGGLAISALLSQTSSAAGYFFTCPPKSIRLTVGDTNQTSVTVNKSNTQPLTATVLDTAGNPITGLALTYTSNDPINIPVSSTGAVTPLFPSDAAITVQCLPPSCNPSPINQIANLGAGLPITSNPVQVHTPGPSSNILYMASPQSYNYVPIDFQSGNVGTPVRLPYQPNSMVMDESGNYLFFGSARETMIVAVSNSGTSLQVEAPNVPGTVLGVAPNDSLVVVHDPCRQLFYLYTPPLNKSAGGLLTFGAPGPTIACDVNNRPIDPSVEVNPPYAASFTQDSQTVYIANGNTLYTYNVFTGWHVCTENGQSGNCPVDSKSIAVTVPGVGAFAAGPTTTAFGYCALGHNNTGQNAGPPPTGIDPDTAVTPTEYYPLAATVPAATDQLNTTIDGNHIIGASAAGELTDIEPAIPSGSCPLNTALQFSNAFTQYNLATPNIQNVDQVLTSPNSQLAFVTYQPTAAGGNSTLPAYQIPCTQAQITAGTCPAGQLTAGKVVNVALTGQAGAPIAGVFSPDTNTFYTSTNGDDLVHFIDTTTLTDTQQVNPGLTCGTTTTAPANPYLACTQGNPVPAMFMASRPRPTQGAPTDRHN